MKKDAKKKEMTNCATKSKKAMSDYADSIAHEELQKKVTQIKVINCVIESIC
jgi:hypothetical protein